MEGSRFSNPKSDVFSSQVDLIPKVQNDYRENEVDTSRQTNNKVAATRNSNATQIDDLSTLKATSGSSLKIIGKKVQVSKGADVKSAYNERRHVVIKPTPKTGQFSKIESSSLANSKLINTFGDGRRKSLREKRKHKQFNVKEKSESVGYTKFTMKGVDILYSFPKTIPVKSKQRKKKQATFGKESRKTIDWGNYIEDSYIGRCKF